MKEALLMAIAGPYVVGSSLAVPYYNYLYANEHGFISWLFFGQIIATIQATVWPFDLLSYLLG